MRSGLTRLPLRWSMDDCPSDDSTCAHMPRRFMRTQAGKATHRSQCTKVLHLLTCVSNHLHVNSQVHWTCSMAAALLPGASRRKIPLTHGSGPDLAHPYSHSWQPQVRPRALCVDWMLMSAPCGSAGVGKSGWKARCAPCASSTMSGTP